MNNQSTSEEISGVARLECYRGLAADFFGEPVSTTTMLIMLSYLGDRLVRDSDYVFRRVVRESPWRHPDHEAFKNCTPGEHSVLCKQAEARALEFRDETSSCPVCETRYAYIESHRGIKVDSVSEFGTSGIIVPKWPEIPLEQVVGRPYGDSLHDKMLAEQEAIDLLVSSLTTKGDEPMIEVD